MFGGLSVVRSWIMSRARGGAAVSRPAVRSTLTGNAPAAPLLGLHNSPPARAANRPARGFTHSVVRFLVGHTGLTLGGSIAIPRISTLSTIIRKLPLLHSRSHLVYSNRGLYIDWFWIFWSNFFNFHVENVEINLLRNADFSIGFTGSAVPTVLHTEPGRSWQLGESSDEFLANNENYKANSLSRLAQDWTETCCGWCWWLTVAQSFGATRLWFLDLSLDLLAIKLNWIFCLVLTIWGRKVMEYS